MNPDSKLQPEVDPTTIRLTHTATSCTCFVPIVSEYTRNHRLLRIKDDDMTVIDASTGEKAKSIKLPGRYILQFDNIEVGI